MTMGENWRKTEGKFWLIFITKSTLEVEKSNRAWIRYAEMLGKCTIISIYDTCIYKRRVQTNITQNTDTDKIHAVYVRYLTQRLILNYPHV